MYLSDLGCSGLNNCNIVKIVYHDARTLIIPLNTGAIFVLIIYYLID